MTLAAIIGVPLGTLILIAMDASSLRLLIGVFVATTTVTMMLGYRKALHHERAASVPVGFLFTLPSIVVGGLFTRDTIVLAVELLPATLEGAVEGIIINRWVQETLCRRIALMIMLIPGTMAAVWE